METVGSKQVFIWLISHLWLNGPLVERLRFLPGGLMCPYVGFCEVIFYQDYIESSIDGTTKAVEALAEDDLYIGVKLWEFWQLEISH